MMVDERYPADREENEDKGREFGGKDETRSDSNDGRSQSGSEATGRKFGGKDESRSDSNEGRSQSGSEATGREFGGKDETGRKFADREDERSMEELHSAYMQKEEQIPEEGNERGPWWMYVVIVCTLAFGFFYMGRYLGEISDRPHVLFSDPVSVEVEAAELDMMAEGRRVYTRLCQACHQQGGAGVPGAFPPLGGSDWVIGVPERPVYIVLHGFQGEIVRNGMTYNAVMPGFGRLLSNAEAASVVTYIRNSFGNEAPEVQPDEVAEMRDAAAGRASPWTEAELNDFIEQEEAGL